jgi:hypothetical protein
LHSSIPAAAKSIPDPLTGPRLLLPLLLLVVFNVSLRKTASPALAKELLTVRVTINFRPIRRAFWIIRSLRDYLLEYSQAFPENITPTYGLNLQHISKICTDHAHLANIPLDTLPNLGVPRSRVSAAL